MFPLFIYLCNDYLFNLLHTYALLQEFGNNREIFGPKQYAVNGQFWILHMRKFVIYTECLRQLNQKNGGKCCVCVGEEKCLHGF